MKALLIVICGLACWAAGPIAAAEVPGGDKGNGFRARMDAVNRDPEEAQRTLSPGAFGRYASGLFALEKEFSKEPEVWEGLARIASFRDGPEALVLARRVRDSDLATEKVRKEAGLTVRKLEQVGRPLDLKFKAVDGRPVDLAALKGKVAMIDFWATWCPPCVESVPHLREIYGKYRGQGFEIIGLSLDRDEKALKSFVEKEKMGWPQRFDGQPWESSVAPKHGITSIPSVWLVDKKGLVRYVAVYDGLEEKIKGLLAE